MSSKNPVILGLKIVNHDTGAALIANGRVVAIAEERLNRVKHSRDYFPKLAIDYCLEALNVLPDQIDLIVVDKVGSGSESLLRKIFENNCGALFPNAKIHIINHHDAHAADAFFCSPFNEAAVLIVDGAGEQIRDHNGVLGTETETLYRGENSKLVEIQKTTHIREMLGFPYTTGIGKLYSFISEGFLNFGQYNEGKMMGLAPYGTTDVLKQIPAHNWYRHIGNHIVCNPKIAFPGVETVKGLRQRHGFRGLIKWLRSESLRLLGYRLIRFSYDKKREPFLIAPNLFSKIKFDKKRRDRKDPLPDKYFADVAHAVQKVLEEVMVEWGRKIRSITGLDNLCVSGGVGLNIDANKRFLDDVGFKKIFVQPAASDTGIALGCALWGAHMIAGMPRFYEMKTASLGNLYSESEIKSALVSAGSKISFKKSSNVAGEAAKLIADGKIIGWFQGGSEYGPRALGNRSILCDARKADMKDIVNNRIKHREPWRPFAASILAEKQREWFELDHQSPFMLLAALVVKEKRKLVPSIVHVDGTCRIQSVTAESNQLYHDLLLAFNELTSVPLVLNTSFNDAGEPIVETPEDALRCFLNTEMDALAIGDYIVTKK